MRRVEAVTESHRPVRGRPFLETIRQDVSYAFRQFAKSPGFAAITIATMALSIGATSAIFSVVDATLLQPLPYPKSEQLVSVQDDLLGTSARDVGMSVPEWKDLQHSGIFTYVSPVGGGSVNLTDSGQPARIVFAVVAPNYLAMLGVKPELGRWFNPEDQTPGFTMEVVISDGLWRRMFGGDPQILGRGVRLDNDVYRLIGVTPPGFHQPGQTAEQRNAELWLAAGFAGDPGPPPAREVRALPATIARLKTGLTIEQAQSQLDVLVASLQKQYSAYYPPDSAWRVRLVPLRETLVGKERQPLMLLLGAVGLVLLIGCVNVANLLLARASGREREMAIRQAIGASRFRLTKQLLTESLLLSLFGGIVGLAILFCAKGLLLRLIPDSLPRSNEISLDWTVLLFAIFVSVASGLFFGMAPGLGAGRLELMPALKAGGRGTPGSGKQARTRRFMVATEFALSMVLLIAAGLLLRSFWDLSHVRLGFDPQSVMAYHIWLPMPNDPKTDIYGTDAQQASLIREILRKGGTLPGVREIAVGTAQSIPLNHAQYRTSMILEGRDSRGNQPPLVGGAAVSPDYFHLMGMPLLRGRLFDDRDVETAPAVAVINSALARTYWPNENPIGMHIKLGAATSPWITVVGVIADARTESLDEEGIPRVYRSFAQWPSRNLIVFLRGQLDFAATSEALWKQVQSIDPELPVFGATTLSNVVSGSLARRRLSMEMVLLFALTALLLSGLGIYGTISYLVSERTKEIGIRLALGAHRGKILRMILLQGLELAIAGTAAGLVGGLIVSHLMASLLYGVRPTDLPTLGGVAVLLTAVALVACYLPAMRATRVDPLVALRAE